ncbi:MAG: cyclic nucleotide-binding domain-containing protein [Spirochaetes bacterium]|nr:cyclic nucleotide-binding domain-containing protein [Spirochaetota bacterium]MBN2771483.1 cyclic nucleotide-binding domain-containing protein [Spirochaetota bacterium]
MNYKLLYEKGHDPDTVYIMQSGEVIFFATNDDRYRITGQNLIIGTSEIILSNLLGIPTKRVETAVVPQKTDVKYVKIDTFLEQFKHEGYLINIARVTAQKLRLTNSIIKKNQDILLSGKKTLKQLFTQYYSIVSILRDEYNKRKLPWLKDTINKYTSSIQFLKAESYAKADIPVKIYETEALSEKTIDLPPDHILCKEGDNDNEMFILQSGTLEVTVNSNRVALINEVGSTIGEISLLLGEKRSATIKTLTSVRVTKLNLNDLKTIAKTDIETILQIVYSLTKKFYNNISLIRDINASVLNKKLEEEEGKISERKEISSISHDLEKLKFHVDELLYSHNADYIREKLDRFLKI